MGEFSDRREPHRRETPKSVLELHSNSWLIHELCEHWGNAKEKQRQDRRSSGTKISDAAHYQRVRVWALSLVKSNASQNKNQHYSEKENRT